MADVGAVTGLFAVGRCCEPIGVDLESSPCHRYTDVNVSSHTSLASAHHTLIEFFTVQYTVHESVGLAQVIEVGVIHGERHNLRNGTGVDCVIENDIAQRTLCEYHVFGLQGHGVGR